MRSSTKRQPTSTEPPLGGAGQLPPVATGTKSRYAPPGTRVFVGVLVAATAVLVGVLVGSIGVLVRVLVGACGVLVGVFVGPGGVLVGVLVGPAGVLVGVAPPAQEPGAPTQNV